MIRPFFLSNQRAGDRRMERHGPYLRVETGSQRRREPILEQRNRTCGSYGVNVPDC